MASAAWAVPWRRCGAWLALVLAQPGRGAVAPRNADDGRHPDAAGADATAPAAADRRHRAAEPRRSRPSTRASTIRRRRRGSRSPIRSSPSISSAATCASSASASTRTRSASRACRRKSKRCGWRSRSSPPRRPSPVDPSAAVPRRERRPMPPAPAAAPPVALAPGMTPQRLYNTALADFTAGQWALCIDGFNTYLRNFARTDLGGRRAVVCRRVLSAGRQVSGSDRRV